MEKIYEETVAGMFALNYPDDIRDEQPDHERRLSLNRSTVLRMSLRSEQLTSSTLDLLGTGDSPNLNQ